MSNKRKRDVSFIKPNEPTFIARMKAQIGYKEGPTIDTKREALALNEDSDEEEKADEKPQVVVLQDGDLTAAEADRVTAEKNDGPADLNERVVFRRPPKKQDNLEESDTAKTQQKYKNKEGSKKKKIVLSFDEEEGEN